MAKTLKFEDKMNRLQELVNSLEDDKTPLDEAIKYYEEGLALSKELQEQLKSFQKKISEISKEK